MVFGGLEWFKKLVEAAGIEPATIFRNSLTYLF